MSIPCVTNDIDGFKKPCLQEGHLSSCAGGECSKCLPQSAEHGLLCWTCWERLTLTLARWPVFAATILELGRVMQPDNGGVRTAAIGHVALTQAFMDVNEVESNLLTLADVGANVERWVTTYPGATDAVQFTRSAEKAFKTHPLTEQAHMTRKRCPKCDQLLLAWNPPAEFEKPLLVTCKNVECQTVYNQDDYEQMELSP